MQKTESIIAKALTDPTVAKAHNAFMAYHFKDYGGAAKEAKEASKDLYKRLKKALKKEAYVGDKEPDRLKDTSLKTKLKRWNQAVRVKRKLAGASETFLGTDGGAGVSEEYVDPKHYYHSYSDEKLHDIVKKSAAAARTSHRRGEGGTVGKFFDRETETASAILKQRKRDKGWG